MRPDQHSNSSGSAFTLIEISIVLVIIGLIIGGVLVGRDLIRASEIRSQIAQFENYSTAINTFRVKYGYLPGDIPAPVAASLNFYTRLGTLGLGDGNGRIVPGPSVHGPFLDIGGETTLFWRDLSDAGVIGESFAQTTALLVAPELPASDFVHYFPQSKIDKVSRVFVNSTQSIGAPFKGGGHVFSIAGAHNTDMDGHFMTNSTVSPESAYRLDVKVDDGFPRSGVVVASSPTAEYMLVYTAGPTACGLAVAPADRYNMASAYANLPLCVLHFAIK